MEDLLYRIEETIEKLKMHRSSAENLIHALEGLKMALQKSSTVRASRLVESERRKMIANLVGIKEASRITGKSEDELRRRIRFTEAGRYEKKPQKKVPFKAIGEGFRKTYVFDRDELIEWVKKIR